MTSVHQVLATLGYGDAIGHEVLGIQRVLRSAGYESDIFVETADYRLEPLTRDYRELVDATHPDNLLLHHFSLGSKASRTAIACEPVSIQSSTSRTRSAARRRFGRTVRRRLRLL